VKDILKLVALPFGPRGKSILSSKMSMHSKCNVTTVNLLKLSVNEARKVQGITG
jgi:hypothetical protein